MRIYVRDFKTLGAFIKSIRKRLALTQEELSEVLKVKRQSISLWERDKAGPRTRTLKELCILADISENDFAEVIDKWY